MRAGRPGSGLIAFAGAPGLADRAARHQRSRDLCLRLFKSNRDAGLLLFAGLLADAVMRAAQLLGAADLGAHRDAPTRSRATPARRTHQKFRTAVADRVGAATARRGLACAFVELLEARTARSRSPGASDEFVAIGADQQRNGERRDPRCTRTRVWASSMPRSATPRKSLTRTLIAIRMPRRHGAARHVRDEARSAGRIRRRADRAHRSGPEGKGGRAARSGSTRRSSVPLVAA